MTADYLPEMIGISPGIFKGRSVRDGYARSWGLQFSDLAEKVRADPLYIEAYKIAQPRTIQSEMNRMNIFLLLKFFIPKVPPGDIIEFGCFKGGSAIFMAKICAELGYESQIWGLDTFGGMPPTDKTIDAHSEGDFADTDLDALQEYTAKCHLTNLHWVKGLFEDTADGVLARAAPFALAHIDCDIRSAVKYSYHCVKNRMVDGGYIAFDDALVSSCLGATEVVEDDVIRGDGLNSEQVFPHYIFRWFAG
jgi:predicted O-methyltransferase YrrM